MSTHPTQSFERPLLASFAAGAAILLGLTALIWVFSLKVVDATRFVIHTHEVLGSLGRLQFQLYRAEAEQRGYLISGSPQYLTGFRQSISAMQVELTQLSAAVIDHPRQKARAALLRNDIAYRVLLLEKNIALVQENGFTDTNLNVTTGTEVDRRIDSLLEEMQDEEYRLLQQRQQTEADRSSTIAAGFLALVLLLTIAVPLLYLRFRNNTREKQAAAAEAARLIAIIDGTPDLIAISTPEGKASFLNRAGRDMLELGGIPADQIRRESIYPRWAIDLIEKVGIPTAIANGSWSGETVFLTRSGREIPVSQVLIAHRQADGSMTLSTIARDISAIKATEKLLAEKNRQIEQASRMKTEFLATMSHELRTPLNAIIGFSSIMRDGLAGEVSPAAQEYAQDILDSGRHLLSLINDILDLSTIESGNMTLTIDLVDGDELAASGLAIMREPANARGIRLTQQISPVLKSVAVDARKTRQIIVNLLSNAVKFSGDGGEVRLRLQLVSRSEVEQIEPRRGQRLFPLPPGRFPHCLEISVRDGGIGISTADLHRLFQPFTQLDASRNRPHEGTGLGLVLVRRLVELQSGALLVESMPGAGSCFTVWLPMREPATSQPIPAGFTPHALKAQIS